MPKGRLEASIREAHRQKRPKNPQLASHQSFDKEKNLITEGRRTPSCGPDAGCLVIRTADPALVSVLLGIVEVRFG
jgi:hypothetical protein